MKTITTIFYGERAWRKDIFHRLRPFFVHLGMSVDYVSPIEDLDHLTIENIHGSESGYEGNVQFVIKYHCGNDVTYDLVMQFINQVAEFKHELGMINRKYKYAMEVIVE